MLRRCQWTTSVRVWPALIFNRNCLLVSIAILNGKWPSKLELLANWRSWRNWLTKVRQRAKTREWTLKRVARREIDLLSSQPSILYSTVSLFAFLIPSNPLHPVPSSHPFCILFSLVIPPHKIWALKVKKVVWWLMFYWGIFFVIRFIYRNKDAGLSQICKTCIMLFAWGKQNIRELAVS